MPYHSKNDPNREIPDDRPSKDIDYWRQHQADNMCRAISPGLFAYLTELEKKEAMKKQGRLRTPVTIIETLRCSECKAELITITRERNSYFAYCLSCPACGHENTRIYEATAISSPEAMSPGRNLLLIAHKRPTQPRDGLRRGIKG